MEIKAGWPWLLTLGPGVEVGGGCRHVQGWGAWVCRVRPCRREGARSIRVRVRTLLCVCVLPCAHTRAHAHLLMHVPCLLRVARLACIFSPVSSRAHACAPPAPCTWQDLGRGSDRPSTPGSPSKGTPAVGSAELGQSGPPWRGRGRVPAVELTGAGPGSVAVPVVPPCRKRGWGG